VKWRCPSVGHHFSFWKIKSSFVAPRVTKLYTYIAQAQFNIGMTSGAVGEWLRSLTDKYSAELLTLVWGFKALFYCTNMLSYAEVCQ